MDEAKSGSTLKTPSSLSAGEVPDCAAGWWVPSDGDGVRVCVPYEHVGVDEPWFVALTAGRGGFGLMSPVSETWESFGQCSLSLNSKINMYLLHTQIPRVACRSACLKIFTWLFSKFLPFYLPPADHYTLQFCNRGVKMKTLCVLFLRGDTPL